MHSKLDNIQSYTEKKKIAEYKYKCEENCDYLCKSKVNLDIHVATVHSKFNDKCEPWFHPMRMKEVNGVLKRENVICNICKKETPEKEDMRKHYEDDHSYIELTTRDKYLLGKTLPEFYGIVHFEEI